MENFKLENLSFRYPHKCGYAIDNISININQGEFVLVCGKSGCGKTTLLRLLKPSLAPHGEINGNIYFNEKEINSLSEREKASEIGFVMQNPDNQIVTDKVWHELAFGLESLGYKTDEIRVKVAEMASFFGIENWFYKNTTELSGGQKQLLNLASVMAISPSVLILDEPTSQLDPIGASEFLRTLQKINREIGTTVIITEHRLEEAFSMADRVIVMDNGKIIASDKPSAIGGILKEQNHEMYKTLPTTVRVHGEIPNSLSCPLNVREGRIWLEEFSKENTINADIIPKDTNHDSEVVVEIKDVFFRYEKKLPDILKGFNLKVKRGEVFSVLGGNGAGKTTALSLVAGINKPYRGEILIKGKNISEIKNLYDGVIGVLPQNPQSVFNKKTVYFELVDILSEKNLSKEEKDEKIKNISILCEIENLLESHPYDLSGGEQQRAALAKILLLGPEILLLDEPTKGMDAQFKEEFSDVLMELKKSGVTIIMVSHDIEFCAEYSDRCALVFDGSITSVNTPREFFKGNNFYTTSANRMARGFIPDAVLADDIILACTGKLPKKEKKPRNTEIFKKKSVLQKGIETKVMKNNKLSKSAFFAMLSLLLLIPLTIYLGIAFLGDRKYYFISLLILLETIVPFCMVFESRKPKARELVIISVLCAIAVAGRAAFFMLPQFKPVVALVIIAGICFGGETGFLVGAVTGFVSNFFFGQGPWTPWQMFSFGIIGFSAGIIFNKGLIKKTKASLCIYGFLATLIIYGGIMNPSSVIQMQLKPSLKIILASYISGAPLDLIHAFSTAFFLWFIAEPMIDKLERVKTKYGLI